MLDIDKALEDIRKEEKRLEKVDWSDPADRAAYLRLRRRKQRLLALPKDRKCPNCGQLKPGSRQWVVFNRERVTMPFSGSAVCRGCAMKYFRKELFSG